ncbi:MAG: transcription-repair coupling factor [Deltaproteobacteria bacterium]|nr:transcription-repair coupling factor [Deltaproteobacteria bacterium]
MALTPDDDLLTSIAEPALPALIGRVCAGEPRIPITGLEGAARALILALLVQATARPLFLLAASPDAAEQLAGDLAFFLGDRRTVALLPACEGLPEGSPIPPEILCQRIEALYHLSRAPDQTVLVTSPAALDLPLPDREQVAGRLRTLAAGREVDREALVRDLVQDGYELIARVEARGEVSPRGGILDVFPPLYDRPLRIEFAGDEVESIRAFDPDSQRSTASLESITLLPMRPGRWAAPDATRTALLGYLPADTLLALDEPDETDQTWEDLVQALAARFQAIDLQTLALADGAAPPVAFRTRAHPRLGKPLVNLKAEGGILSPLAVEIREAHDRGLGVHLICRSQVQADRLGTLLQDYGLAPVRIPGPWPLEALAGGSGAWSTPHAGAADQGQGAEAAGASGPTAAPAGLGFLDATPALWVGALSRGFLAPEFGLLLITEEEIFGEKRKRPPERRAQAPRISLDLRDLEVGDHVVHVDHGIGLYKGLVRLEVAGQENDFLHLEYAGGDKLYLPVQRLTLIQKYVGADGARPALDRLGGTSWERVKKRVRESVREMARELLDLYAARKVLPGHPYSKRDRYYTEFEAGFEYQETPDQLQAIEEVLVDMEAPKPMDRLVCGDVGYGKTEVAMRAAFKAVMDGRQVAVLVPTTVLALQHEQTFRRRFQPYPVRIEMLSRLRPAQQQKQVVADLKAGRVDIAIGTHRLLQRDIAFRELGLLIIDEEQRFGVRHKERLKQLRKLVDVLTLTATPIPRTLHMSLVGIRDMSTIATPPEDRLAIRTFLCPFQDEVIREAIRRELQRGGQVFFVHNRVQDIHRMADFVRRLVPEAHVGVAHGQMDERALERVMIDFLERRHNVLVCTTIIESGLDFPAANTILINRADAFGLAQLYQLRGRVGRAKERAYAYLLVPGKAALSADARKRLKVIEEFSHLGAGFQIAAYDLEIRGAGNLLGPAQSGQIAAVGFELYSQLLEHAIRELKGEEVLEPVNPEVNLGIPAFIPDDYVNEVRERLVIYKRLSAAEREEELQEIAEELQDRYGPRPPRVEHLLRAMEIRVLAKRVRAHTVECDGRRLRIALDEKSPVDPTRIVALVGQHRDYKFRPDLSLVAALPHSDPDSVFASAKKLLKALL